VRDERYVYRAIDAMTFELCATFDRESEPPGIAGDEFWKHAKGRVCFTQKVRSNAPE
jgi:hypothetical protein